MTAPRSPSLQRRPLARLLSASACAFLVTAPFAARAQTSTLPPTDISNHPANPSPGAAPPPAPPPGLPPEPEPVPAAPVAPVPVPAPPPLEVAPPVAPMATPAVPALVLPVSPEPLAGFSDGNAVPAFARQRLHPLPQRPPAGRHLPLPLLGRQEQGQDPEQHLPAPARAPGARRLDRNLRLLQPGRRLRRRPARRGRRRSRSRTSPPPTTTWRWRPGGTSPSCRSASTTRRSRWRTGLGQVLRLHGAFDHRARLRHPRQQGDGRDAVTGSTTTGTTTTRWPSSTATARTSRTSTTSSTGWAAAWVAPFSFWVPAPLHDVTIGGSFWTGDRATTRWRSPSQTTQGGFTFLSFAQFTTTYNGTANTAVQMRQVGRMNAAAGEINAPIDHKYGVRWEFVWRHSPLSEETIASNGAGTIVRGADLRGYSIYGEALVLVAGRRSHHRRSAGTAAVPALQEVRRAADAERPHARGATRHLDENARPPTRRRPLTHRAGRPALDKGDVDSGELGVELLALEALPRDVQLRLQLTSARGATPTPPSRYWRARGSRSSCSASPSRFDQHVQKERDQ